MAYKEGATRGQLRGANYNRPGDMFQPDIMCGKPAYFDVSMRGANRPGDMFQPDIMCGKPAYFDVSMRGAEQPSHTPGDAAGKAGEMEKDPKHEEDVKLVNSIFFTTCGGNFRCLDAKQSTNTEDHRFQSQLPPSIPSLLQKL